VGLLNALGRGLARFLTTPRHTHGIAPATHAARLLAVLRPADVLLVEGNTRISTAIKYLTQSTWSHAALYVGTHLGEAGRDDLHQFIEADTVDGVRRVSVSQFENFHTRICRPVRLTEADCRRVTQYAIARLGHRYDLRNVIDLARYLLPTPPVPEGVRRRMISLGSGDPTRAICSTLIAQAFQSVHYPILPDIGLHSADRPDCPGCVEEILRVRHHSLFAPRDFDVSPYFEIVKPLLDDQFDYRNLHWEEPATLSASQAPHL
jgi:hypothetical protein